MTFANNLSSVVTRIANEFNNIRNEKANTANTLAGYGIADAYTKMQTDTTISNAVNLAVSWTTIFTSTNTSGSKTLNSNTTWNAVKSTYKEVMFIGITGGNTVSSTIVPTEMIVANYAYNTPRNDTDYVIYSGLTDLADGSFTTTFNGNVVSTTIYAR